MWPRPDEHGKIGRAGSSPSRPGLSLDGYLLLTARGLRMFAYGFLSVVLALFLSELGLSPRQVGALFTTALLGGALTTTGVSLLADRWGRRQTLKVFGLLMAVSGSVLAMTKNFWVLFVISALGTISPSGQEVGPFLSLEQAALPQTTKTPGEPVQIRSYAWYNLAGSLAVAAGALVVGLIPPILKALGWSDFEAQRSFVWAFAGTGLVLSGLYTLLSPRIDAQAAPDGDRRGGLRASRGAVLRLSTLFGVDALAGGLVIQSLVAFWFHQRFGVTLEQLGPLFFGTNLLSALSFLIAARLAERFGLLNTMVFTHLPSNVLLALVPLMPSWPLAAAALLARHALSQMDVPTRQAYTMALVGPSERSAAAGFTNAVRTAASSVAPAISGFALQTAATGLPFILSGALKSGYDLTLWLLFRRVPLRETSSTGLG